MHVDIANFVFQCVTVIDKICKSADSDEMPHYVTINLVLHCLPKPCLLGLKTFWVMLFIDPDKEILLA